MILGLNSSHHALGSGVTGPQLRSHSTDKQASNFISKLDSKVAQLTSSGAQDDSGMMRGLSNGAIASTTMANSSNNKNQFKKTGGNNNNNIKNI
jgi:hypothetical protein